MERTTKAGRHALWLRLVGTFGSWDALWEASPKDADGNVLTGDVQAIGVRNSLVQSEGLVTALVGVRGVVVVTRRTPC